MSSPLVIIDDTSSSIQYSGDKSGPWFELDGIGDTRIISNTSNPESGEPFQYTLHGVNVTASFSFPFNGMPRLLYQSALKPFHSIVIFRNRSPCLRDSYNNKCFWDPRSNLGVFSRQCQHRLVSCVIGSNQLELDSLWRLAGPVSRWIPFAHCESKRFESANFFVWSDSVCSICQRLAKSITSAHRFNRLSNSV